MSAPRPATPAPTAGQRGLLVLLGVVALVPILLLSLYAVIRIPYFLAGDYLTYVAGGTRLLAGSPLYPDFQLAGPFVLAEAAFGVGFVYPPTAAIASVPFALLSPQVGFAVFAAASGVLLAALVFLIARREGMGRWAATGFAAVYLVSAPAIESILTGQANTVVAAIVAASWLWPRASGYLAVLGALVKLFPLAGVAWALRERAPVVRPLLLGAALVAVSVLVVGPGAWMDFVTTLRNGQGSPLTVVPSPRELASVVLGGTAGSLAVYAAAGLMALASLRVPSRYGAFALVSVAMILPGPDWFLHYFLIPLVGAAPWLAARLVGLGRAWSGSAATLS